MIDMPRVPKATPLDPTVVHAMRRHGRIWRIYIAQALTRETQFRANFLASIGIGLLQLTMVLIPVLLLFSFTDTVAGWTRSEVIALTGMYWLAQGLLTLFISPNAFSFWTYISQGNLDLIVVKPMSAQFSVMVRRVEPAEIFAVLSGFAVLATGLTARGWPTVDGTIRAILLLACGLVMVSCVLCAISWVAFWTIKEAALTGVVGDLLAAGRYPNVIYPKAMRLFFIGIVPIAFATSFPTEALLGRGTWWVVMGAIALTATFLLLLRAWWRFAIRFYTSASS